MLIFPYKVHFCLPSLHEKHVTATCRASGEQEVGAVWMLWRLIRRKKQRICAFASLVRSDFCLQEREPRFFLAELELNSLTYIT